MAVGKTRVRGITIKLDADASNLAKALGKVSSEINNTQRDLKDVQNLLKLDPRNVELLRQKQQLLNDEIKETDTRLHQARTALDLLAKEPATEDVTRQMDALKRQIIADEDQLKSLQDELKSFGSIGKQQILAVIEQVKELGTKVHDAGEKISGIGRNMSRYLTKPILGVGKEAIEMSSNFEQAMAQVESVTAGASSYDIEQLGEMALDLSSKTKFSATEAAEGLYYMGLAGWNATEQMQALPNVLNLAAAGDMDLGIASDIVTDYITAFGLEAQDATRLVDVMASTMTNSNTTVEQMGEAFKYAAPVAGALGYSVEDVSLALGIMANNGVKGTQAGTSLRSLFSRLAKPTKEVQGALDKLGISIEDANGEILPFRKVMDQLRTSFGKSKMPAEELTKAIQETEQAFEDGELTEEEYEEALLKVAESAYGVEGAEKAKNAAIIGGLRGMSGLLAITNATAQDFEGLAYSINNASGAAENVASVMMDTLQGRTEILKHNVEALAISFGEILLPVAEKVVAWGGKIIDALKSLDDGTKETIVQIGLLVAAAGPALLIIGKIVSAIGLLMAHPVAAAIGIVVAGLGLLVASLITTKDEITPLNEKELELQDTALKLRDAYKELHEEQTNENIAIRDSFDEYETLYARLRDITDETGKVKEGYEEEAQFIVGTLNEALDLNIQYKDGQIEQYKKIQREIEKTLKLKEAEALLSANEAEYAQAKKDEAAALAKYSEAVNEQKKREKELSDALKKKEEIERKIKDVEGKLEVARKEAIASGREWSGQMATLTGELTGLQTELNNEEATIRSAQAAHAENAETVKQLGIAYAENQSTIRNYNDLSKVVTTGVGDIDQAMQNMTYNLVRSEEANEEVLNEQYEYYLKTFNDIYTAAQESGSLITDEAVRNAAEMLIKSKEELDRGGVKWKRSGWELAQEFLDNYNERMNRVYPVTKEAMDTTLSGIGSYESRFGREGQKAMATYDQGLRTGAVNAHNSALTIGENIANGVASGISSKTWIVENASTAMARKAVNAANHAIRAHSPSKLMEKTTGRWFTEGFAIGIEKNGYMAESAAYDVAMKSAHALEEAAITARNMGLSSRGVGYGNAISTTNTTNLGGVTITVNAAPGQSEEQISDMVSDRINRQINQLRAAYA